MSDNLQTDIGQPAIPLLPALNGALESPLLYQPFDTVERIFSRFMNVCGYLARNIGCSSLAKKIENLRFNVFRWCLAHVSPYTLGNIFSCEHHWPNDPAQRPGREQQENSMSTENIEQSGSVNEAEGQARFAASGLLACPFCGSDDVGFPPGENGVSIQRWITCFVCECDGPVSYGNAVQERAVKLWNQRGKSESAMQWKPVAELHWLCGCGVVNGINLRECAVCNRQRGAAG